MELQPTDISQLSGDHKRALLKKLLEKRNRTIASNHGLEPAEPGRYPLSAGQKGLWVTHQLSPHNYAYNTPLTFNVIGSLDTDALRLALERLVHRHDALRTRIVNIDGKTVNDVAPTGELFFKAEDIAGLDDVEIVAHLKRIIRKPFELQAGPLMRVYLFSKSHAEHILLFNFHHIIFDGGSIAPLLNDLNQLYNAVHSKALNALPPLETTYDDFVDWQKEMLAGDKGRIQKEYWLQQLKGASPILELPTDRHRPPIPSLNGAVHDSPFSPHLSARLKTFAEAENVSLFALFLSIFKVLLYRYTSQEDILVGTPLETRPGTRFEALIGYFVNMVAIRSVCSGDMSFKDILQQVQATAFEALEHGDYPFSEIVRELAPDHDRSRSPLFQTAFAYQNWAIDIETIGPATLACSGLSFEPMFDIHQEGEFDLTLEVVETATEHQVFFKYNPDLFDEATINRMAGHFRTLAESIIAEPEKAVSRLQLLTDAERHQIVTVWNNTRVDFLRDKCIHQLFEEQVERTPDAVAVVCEDHRLTYRELNARANQLARYLRSLGVGPDVLVGICVERSLEMMVGLMGILKAGGAYLPIDPAYPEDRIAFMLTDSQASVLLTQEKLVETLPSDQSRLVRLDRDWDIISVESEANFNSDSSNENLAYCIYTSGSTGRPKGVLIPHSGLLNLIFWHQRAFGVTAADRATQLAGTAFDASVWEIWPYLTAGASLHLPKAHTMAAPELLKNWLVSQQITISFLPTPLAEELLALSWSENTALRIMLTGGDKLSRYPSTNLPFQLVNNYGPTENTVVTTSGVVTADNRGDGLPHIGAPIANTQVYILDTNLQPVPIGVPGEIHIGGASLARAYLNRKDLTAEKFIPHPFDDNPDQRLYKTGDWACFLPNGNIKFVGRIDNQVKIRGFRIELGEIEAALVRHETILQAVVMLREDRPGDKQLTAYVVAEPDRKPSAGALRQFLKKTLPAYMVPAAIVLLDTFPLTPNGKVNHSVLPKPEVTQCLSAEHYAAPLTDTEKKLAAVWDDVLNMAR
ncbi:MAG: amino acid adenylation domain-containing protein, partial [Desulfobacteraceae bacterium]